MTETSFQRYHDRKAPTLYALIDLIIPGCLLYIIHTIIGLTGWGRAYTTMAILSGIFFFLATAIQRGYSRYNERSISKKLEITFKTWFINVLFLLVITYFYLATLKFDRLIMSSWVILTPLFVITLKSLISYFNRKLSKAKINVLILGNHYSFNEFELNMLKSQNIQLSYIKILEAERVKQKTLESSPDYLLLNLEKPASSDLIKELTHLDVDGIKLIALHNFMEVFLRKCYIPYDKKDLSYLEKIRSYSLSDYILKRIIDWLVVLLLGAISIPIILFSMYKIKKESPGKLFFCQSRVGLKGKNFMAIKFRSMHENAKFNPYTQKEDPRIYPYGNFMRKARIDELPQLWNVVKGDMHLLGPRTEWDILVENYEKEIPYYHERHLVRPGISGWAQVLYPYGANTEDSRQKLMYDLYYIKHWSIWLEIEALIRTVGVVLGKKGL
ncbi:UDP-N-acetylgalactosamine-undecaprenyl-phosphate N-acetylgalactosaminephosphotransferase [Marinomonas spartinae]|uniref:UDP-N-acetylgalactosamine-undecaprenyl-phosphate N-acetylgalactosaminephosphotransferase n=1 Tax=Marinomonas spartinae TaxID=1792290 RepID=A0A1A8T7E3_9GAMM|nr:sugar transferase [Marinomonas spartinae]SBS27068.1 UDP-N-acetylgalactosamine-undecaprenyl-phosphate N-acetylgalactosaminephosphotransferase [Marinomonas spartinae]